ncbi:hypothetical protein [Gorillibacterium sp. CAU 1737]|uniref:hypothetical protein n=1 Tax=Gorillibacterium sp. CAU 1737 TaxID=3140362 RepID=UPI00326172C5
MNETCGEQLDKEGAAVEEGIRIRKKRWWVGMAVTVLLGLAVWGLTACDGREGKKAAPSAISAATVGLPSPNPGASAGPTVQPSETVPMIPSFRDLVEEVSFFQQDDSSAWPIVGFEAGGFPRESQSYAVNLGVPYGFIKFKSMPEEDLKQLLPYIRVDGEPLELTLSNPDYDKFEFRWELPRLQEPAVLEIGDFPAITLTPPHPFTMETDGPVLLRSAAPYYQILLPSTIKTTVLTFSEPIRREELSMEGRGDHKWLGERRLQITLPRNEKSGRVTLSYRSATMNQGVRLPGLQIVEVIQKPEAYWAEAGKEGGISWSMLDGFYDRISFSPDRSSYVGFVPLQSVDTDAKDSRYALILERRGQPPRILEPVVSFDPLDNDPIDWLDQNRFLFTNGDAVLEYDTRQKGRKAVQPLSLMEGVSPSFTAYDRVKDRLYVGYVHFNSEAQQFPIDVTRYAEQGRREISRERAFTHTYEKGKYNAQSALPHITPSGIFWRGMQEGTPVTWFEQEDGASITSLNTRWVAGDEQGVYLQEMKQEGEGAVGTDRYRYWDPLAKSQKLQDRVLPPLPSGGEGNNGYKVQPFGPQLLAVKMGEGSGGSSVENGTAGADTRLLFDKSTWSWKPLPAELAGSHIPVQYEQSLYRVKRTS